jgi:hypothetical protein
LVLLDKEMLVQMVFKIVVEVVEVDLVQLEVF